MKVDVSVSNPFFAWVLGYAGDMTIAGPENVKEEYRILLRRSLQEMNNEYREGIFHA